jgi:hypothetical protein
MRSAKNPTLFSYREITDEVYCRMHRLMEESRSRKGYQSLQRREWAYGLYIGWRALVAERADNADFDRDDKTLESLLNNT